MAHIAELATFPVKGCAGVRAAVAELTPAGLRYDRSYLVTDPDGLFRTQRTNPRLALIQPDPGDDALVLHGPDLEPLRVPVEADGPRHGVTMFGRPYRAIDQGAAAADWLSTVLGAPSRLVRVPPEHDRVTSGTVPGTAGFADSTAVHLLARSTVDTLADRLVAAGAEPVPADRFRANLVVDGWPDPHTEDRLRQVRIGETELGYAKLAIRCVVTTVAQDEGRRDGPEPLRTLATYRRARAGGVALGIKLAVLRPGKLRVGDELDVTAWGDSEF